MTTPTISFDQLVLNIATTGKVLKDAKATQTQVKSSWLSAKIAAGVNEQENARPIRGGNPTPPIQTPAASPSPPDLNPIAKEYAAAIAEVKAATIAYNAAVQAHSTALNSALAGTQ